MADEKEHFEKRTIELEVTKRRAEEGEQTTEGEGGNCGSWFIEVRGGHIYTCRWCATQGPTAFPYKECIQLPD